ncbi:SDR family oxidoreductase shroud isoform X1 [Leptinotarsa decemlineata]|uniref:SDR family oxidoreductase shroud isoform X1 n=1 Tax=Leptinotarsa decemlineata TaxID=7539 RepID=UPI000C2527E0|nr:D-beta-hydroxybutyrate dehydrogenase, mitochondrial isoform X1 [Leptinotarsa decemlineata]
MGSLSKFLLIAFEITNELYTALGAGVLGMVVLLKHGFQNHQCVKTLSVVAFTAGCWVYINREHESLKPSKKKVVCITGCDSGLGFSLAQHAVQMGFTVIAGFLSLDSKGCKEIKQLFGSNIIQIQLDITDSSSVQASVQTLEHFLGRNPGYSLHAVINNAGVMVFGEFEWLTEKLIQQQLDVNLMGTFKFTNALCPLLRRYKARVITITSHCAQTTLPGLSVYGATKSALAAWSDAFRIEMNKYSVDVLTFIPGSFTTQSNIMARQLQNVQEMHDSFSPEQHSFYSDYFKAFNMYLSFLTPPPKPVKIDDEPMYRVFERTLLDKYPDVIYKHEPLRYWFYHLLFKISPRHLRDYFIKKFLQMPEYVPAESKDSEDDIDDIDV